MLEVLQPLVNHLADLFREPLHALAASVAASVAFACVGFRCSDEVVVFVVAVGDGGGRGVGEEGGGGERVVGDDGEVVAVVVGGGKEEGHEDQETTCRDASQHCHCALRVLVFSYTVLRVSSFLACCASQYRPRLLCVEVP